MALTVAEATRELERLKHSRAVWMEIVEHLSKFVDQEVRQAEHGIVAEGCVENRVPQPVIKEFVAYINDQEIDPLNKKIGEIEGLTVTETKDNEPETQGPIRPPGTPHTDQSPKASPSGKKLGAVPSPPGRKAQSSG